METSETIARALLTEVRHLAMRGCQFCRIGRPHDATGGHGVYRCTTKESWELIRTAESVLNVKEEDVTVSRPLTPKPCSKCGTVVRWDDSYPVICSRCEYRKLTERFGDL